MKKTVSMLLIIAVVVMLASCGCANRLSQPTPTPSATPTATPAPSPTATAAPTPKAPTHTMTFTFMGRIDTNFIEALLPDGSYTSLRLSDTLTKSFDSLGISEGTTVEAKYTQTDSGKTIIEFVK